jgi:hypothetical protein
LRESKYDYSYYRVPGGFALIARLERIDDTGKALSENERFLPPDAKKSFDIGSYVGQLFLRNPVTIA